MGGIRSGLDLNPAIDVLHFNDLATSKLEDKVRGLIDKMNEASSEVGAVTDLLNELNVLTEFSDDKVTSIKFENTPFQEMIDRLHDKGVLHGERKYNFETKKEIEMFKASLETQQYQLKTKSSESLIMMEALLKLLQQMNDIAKACSDSQEKLLQKINENTR